MKYENLAKHLEKKGFKVEIDQKKAGEQKFKNKTFSTLSAKEKYEILEQIARDFRYID